MTASSAPSVNPKAIERELFVAEGVGFEPTVPSRTQRFSRPPDSATLASLRARRLADDVATICEEVPQERCSRNSTHAAENFDLVVEAGIRTQIEQ